ncbi:MAG: hypothetical protein ACPGOV_14695 [Magnetovibrionaceae bacterium]
MKTMTWLDTIGVGVFIGLGLILAAGVAQADEATPYSPLESQLAATAPIAVSNVKPRVEAIAFCQYGMAVFKIRNVGASWPGQAAFRITRGSDGKTVALRNFRLYEGQRASLRLRDEGQMDTYAVRVEPSWQSSAKKIDDVLVRALADCSAG